MHGISARNLGFSCVVSHLSNNEVDVRIQSSDLIIKTGSESGGAALGFLPVYGGYSG